MKKIALILFISIFANINMYPCSGYDPDSDFYNLFIQEIIDDPLYYPFLLTYGSTYYYSNAEIKNENIEEWQQYLGLSYDATKYLVFNATREEVQNLIKGNKINNKNLDFITSEFANKHKQALLYLAYAKYLEPYMSIKTSGDNWYYYDKNHKTADQLDYNNVINVLERSWNAEKDNELKLRYGYQLVRFAHYNRFYEEAINFFDKYVEPLNYKPAMYYHALSQKAGAQMGLGETTMANYHFLQVFANSKNLKENAANSIRLSNEIYWGELLEMTKNNKEKNDAYLLLGYFSFNNPLNEIEKIIENSPDAIQAKTLMARAVNMIEREYLPIYYPNLKGGDNRYPLINNDDDSDYNFFWETLVLADKMTNNPNVKEKNFWYITSAYLNFLNKNYSQARNTLNKVETTNAKYTALKNNLDMYITISESENITPELEEVIYSKYIDMFNGNSETYGNHSSYHIKGFITDVLANRYFLQEDYAKSFLLNNYLITITENPQLDLLEILEAFILKPDKNKFEEYILNKSANFPNGISAEDYINQVRGIIYLTKGDLDKASEAFNNMQSKGYIHIPSRIFGYNLAECFECNEELMIEVDYLSDFQYIEDNMYIADFTKALIKLRNEGNKNTKLSAKANYMIGNFYYNTTRMGYYRQFLRFDQTNGYSYKFNNLNFPDIYEGISFKFYKTYYENPVDVSQKYLEKAYTQAKEDELKAKIVFALSKCEQELYEDGREDSYWGWRYSNGDNILISNRKYFKELMKYKNTDFFSEAATHCKYFEYYVNNN